MGTAGYSGTPLAKKLGYKSGGRIFIDGMADTIRHEIRDGLDVEPTWLTIPEDGMRAAHIFVTGVDDMIAKLSAIEPLLARDGMIWVSWPKKASGIASEVDGDEIRKHILPNTDLVDVKVCAVDETWSGLKLMIRKERR